MRHLEGSQAQRWLRGEKYTPQGIYSNWWTENGRAKESHVNRDQHCEKVPVLEVASIETTTSLSMEEAETAVRAALAEQGFGVLTEIDVAATLRAKLGVERPPMKILGACSPSFANRALEFDQDASLLLPCNVVLSETVRGTRIAAVDPRTLMSGPEFAALANEAADCLIAAIAAVPVA